MICEKNACCHSAKYVGVFGGIVPGSRVIMFAERVLQGDEAWASLDEARHSPCSHSLGKPDATLVNLVRDFSRLSTKPLSKYLLN